MANADIDIPDLATKAQDTVKQEREADSHRSLYTTAGHQDTTN